MDAMLNADMARSVTAFPLQSDYGSAWIALTWFRNKPQSPPEKRLIQLLRDTYSQYNG